MAIDGGFRDDVSGSRFVALRSLVWAIGVGLLVVATVACGEGSASLPAFDGDCGDLHGPAALVGTDIGSGALVWERTVGDATGVAKSGSVLAATGRSGATLGIDVASGELLWCRDLGQLNTQGGQVQPGFASVGDTIATMTANGDVVALNPQTGEERWRTSVGVIEGSHVEPGDTWFYVFDGGAVSSWFGLDAASGRRLDDIPAPRTGATNGTVSVIHGTAHVAGRQEVDVRVLDDGLEMWDRRLPGFVVELHNDAVIVIDQTGGTGVFRGTGDTRVAAYELSTGEQRWQIPLPGTPHLAVEDDDLVIVPVDSAMYAIERSTGEIAWESDHGSPGLGGRFSVEGNYRLLVPTDATTSVLVGLIVAEEPYRD